MMKPEVQRRKQRSRERQECPVHAYQRHGKEAQELRKGVESILSEWGQSLAAEDAAVEALLGEMRELLDDVDARDSLAYLERCDEDVGRRSGPRQGKAP